MGVGWINLQGFFSLAADLLFDVALVQAQDPWLQLDITRLVHTVHIPECGSNREIRADLAQRIVDLINIATLGVKGSIVDTSVVNTVFFTASYTDFHLEPDTNLAHPLEVLDAGANVFFVGFFGKVEHMRGEERLSMLPVVCFIGFEHTVKPLQELLGAVIRVEDDRNAVRGGDGTDKVRGGDRAGNRSLLILVVETLTAEEGATALRDLYDYWRLDVAGSL